MTYFFRRLVAQRPMRALGVAERKMCALAGLINTARLAAGSPSSGTSGELDAIAACFIGGTSMRGGSGTVYGPLIDALGMASLDNGRRMLDVEIYWQMTVKGTILTTAVWVDA